MNDTTNRFFRPGRRRPGALAGLACLLALALAASRPAAVVSGGEAQLPTAPASAQAAPAQPAAATGESTAAAPAEGAAAAPAADAGPKKETPAEEAARKEAEYKEKRELERKEIMEQAEQFIETADEKLFTTLPYPLNFLFGAKLFGFTLWRFLASLGLVVLGVFLIYAIARRFATIQKKLASGEVTRKWVQAFDVAVLGLRNPLKLFLFGILIRSFSSLMVTKYHPDIVWLSDILIFLAGIIYFFDLVGIVDRVYGDRIFTSSDRLMDTVRPMVLKLVRFFILLVAGLHIYQNLTGQTMFSLLAGLGIGGIALALASQQTLQNVLGFASIAFDKSFLVGDAVTIANYDGTVEHVGLRSTLLRSYDGNGIVIPNSTAINSNIINRNRRPYIRREIRIGLSPLNSHEKVTAAMDAIMDAVGEHEGKVSGLPPVVRFVEYEPARFVIQVLFWYDSNQPFFYDECSRVNLLILKRLSDLGVLFAER